MTRYEIKCSQTWAWYEGYVHDYQPKKKVFEVSYENDWKPVEYVAADHIRKVPSTTKDDLEAWVPKVNDLVECKAKAEENEPYGWWSCTLRAFHKTPSSTQNLYYVAFDGWGDQHNEMLEQEYIRPKSNEKTLSHRSMARVEIDVEETVCAWVQSKPADFQLVLQYPKLVHSYFRKLPQSFEKTIEIKQRLKSTSQKRRRKDDNHQKPGQETHTVHKKITIGGKLIIIAPQRTCKRIQDFVYLKLEQRKVLLLEEKKTYDKEIQLQQQKRDEETALKHSFHIHPLLTGFLLGTQRKHIVNVRNHVPGIVNIRVENGECQIRAKTQEALDYAIDYLQISAKKVIVPYHEMAFIIGRNGNQIRELRAESGARVVSWNQFPRELQLLKDRYFERVHRGGNDNYDDNSRGRYRYNRNNARNDEHIAAMEKQIGDCTIDDLFNEEDVMDFTRNLEEAYRNVKFRETDDYTKTDALVIIGRRSRVNLCLTMIQLMIEHLRNLENLKIESHRLHNNIRKLKGYDEHDYAPRPNDNHHNHNHHNQSQSPRQYNNDRPYFDNRRGNYRRMRGRGRNRGRGYRARQYSPKNYNDGFNRGNVNSGGSGYYRGRGQRERRHRNDQYYENTYYEQVPSRKSRGGRHQNNRGNRYAKTEMTGDRADNRNNRSRNQNQNHSQNQNHHNANNPNPNQNKDERKKKKKKHKNPNSNAN